MATWTNNKPDPLGFGKDEGEGSRKGSLGNWDVLGNALDKSNPFLTSTKNEADAYDAELQGLIELLKNSPELQGFSPVNYVTPEYQGDAVWRNVAAQPDIVYDPIAAERAALERVGKSNFEDLSSDPRLKADQMAALSALKELADNGGMTAQDRANLARIQSQVAQADRGRRDAILQNAHARGMSGGGQELLAQLQSSQAATDRSAQQGLDVAGMAQQRALEAMMQSGQLAGNIRGQDWDEAARRAAAMDAINTFNTSQANDMSRFNVSQGNEVNKFNAGNTLRTAEGNRAVKIDNDQYNADHNWRTDLRNLDARTANNVAKTGIMNDQTRTNQIQLPALNNQNITQKYGWQKDAAQASADRAGGKLNSANADAARKQDTVLSIFGSFMGAAGGGGGGGRARRNTESTTPKIRSSENAFTTPRKQNDEEDDPTMIA